VVLIEESKPDRPGEASEAVCCVQALTPIQGLDLLLLVDPKYIGHICSIDMEDLCLLVEANRSALRLCIDAGWDHEANKRNP